MLLQEFNFKVIYRAGRQQQHVDIFSRDVTQDADERYVLDRIGTPSVYAVESVHQHEILSELKIPQLHEFRQAVEVEKQLNPKALVWDKVACSSWSAFLVACSAMAEICINNYKYCL